MVGLETFIPTQTLDAVATKVVQMVRHRPGAAEL
jgi:hypothetical protein